MLYPQRWKNHEKAEIIQSHTNLKNDCDRWIDRKPDTQSNSQSKIQNGISYQDLKKN